MGKSEDEGVILLFFNISCHVFINFYYKRVFLIQFFNGTNTIRKNINSLFNVV